MDPQGTLDVVLGTGALGRAVAEESARQGHRVRLVNRRGRMAEPPADAGLHAADLTDARAAQAACAGAATVYLCANVPYTDWPARWPPLAAGVLEGVARAGARLVYGDNLYAYGPAAGPLHEDLPYAATGAKGRVRAEIADRLLAAHRAGRVRVTIGRASDFYGPWATDSSLLGSRVVPAALTGGTGQVIGNVDLPHTFTYIRDYARALVTLGLRDEALGRAWHVPSAETMTQRALLRLVWEEAGAGAPRFRSARGWLVSALGLVSPLMRELAEMMYEWERPFVVDHARFAQAFGADPTPHREALRETVAWFRAHGPARNDG
jgi:nucleoside-diphosphate-sugar epimerase